MDFSPRHCSLLSVLPCTFVAVIQGKDEDEEGVNATIAPLPGLPSLQTTILHFLGFFFPNLEEESNVNERLGLPLQW